MSRPIDAEWVIKRLQAKNPSNDYMKVMLDECIAEIQAAPLIEPERKKGKWMHISVDRGCDETICSVCRQKEPYKFAAEDALIYNFCPHCGADMRGMEDE